VLWLCPGAGGSAGGDGGTFWIRVWSRQQDVFFPRHFPGAAFGLHVLPLHCSRLEKICGLSGIGKASERESILVESRRFYMESAEDDNSQSDDDTRMDVKTDVEDIVESFTNRIERRKLPPYEKTQEHFIALGLCGEGKTIAQIWAQNLVSKEDCIRLFSNPISCTQFKYGDCKDPKLKAKIAKIWPLIYTKTCVAKRLSYEFTRAIIVDTCADRVQVNWTDFAVEKTWSLVQNTRQQWEAW
jgi:hypothetical protein